MRNIWTVFKTDIRSLSKCFFACVVVVAIALLPSLYAWLNIYSNWDPYGNTGGISIAVASLDEGYTDADGTYENKGDDVVADLREATSINWVIVDTEEAAKGGVESGDYYAAVVIDKQFSRNMFRMLTDWTGKPAITYYENAKKNAVATKITDTAVETLKRSISENYLEVVISGIMEQSNLLAADLTETDPETAVKGLLYQAQDVLSGCRAMMDAFRAAGSTGVSETDAQALSDAIASINSSLPDGDAIADSAARLQHALYTALANVERALDRFESALDTAQPPAAQQQLRDAAAAMGKLSTQLSGLAGQLDGINVTGNPVLTAQAIQLRELAGHCAQLQNALNQLADGAAGGLLADCGALVEAIRNAAARIPVTDRDLRRQLDTVVSEVSDAMDGVKSLSADAKAMRAALSDTTAALSVTMEQLRPAAERMVNALSDTIDKLEGMTAGEYMDMLLEILGGDPAAYSRYFPEMVQTTVNKVYPIENYGSAMAPFYTTLAIWVGGVILSSLVKIHARTEGLVAPRPAELYFGRYLFFFLLSQIQAAVIVTGDLYLLKIQCLHPGLLYLTASLTAFTFSLLIYSLAIAFGDVGKAVVVVIMVMQIAGSSGTFPIELLPAIYQKIYRFFPFPYAIDAMRECICGMYGNYYWQQIGFLLLFAAAALLIGLLVRRPFMGLNRFMEEKLEETELL